MPTKLNRAGEQQNYVPSGNGDASGEYGDNATGSNKHFKQFAKPSESIGIDKKDDKPIEYKPSRTKEDLKNAVIKCIGKLTPNAKKLLKHIENVDGDKRIISLFANMYESGNYTFALGKNYLSYFGHNAMGYKKLSLGEESLDGNSQYNTGSVFYHESGHALDYTSTGENHWWSLDYKSKKYNMTLQESVNDELSIFKDEEVYNKMALEIKDFYNSYNEKIQKEKDKYLEAQPIIRKYDEEVNEYINQKHKEMFGFQVGELIDKMIKGEISWEEMQKTRKKMNDMKDKLKDEFSKNHPEYQKNLKQYRESRDKMLQLELQQNGDTFKKYGDLSDMVQAITNKKLKGGHDFNYFLGYDGKENQATECFAEITSAKSTNPESYKVLQKYIPRTLEIYEELIEVIENGTK